MMRAAQELLLESFEDICCPPMEELAPATDGLGDGSRLPRFCGTSAVAAEFVDSVVKPRMSLRTPGDAEDTDCPVGARCSLRFGPWKSEVPIFFNIGRDPRVAGWVPSLGAMALGVT
mmetsp:Transcript_87995/g.193009  ORF Transcript_87995/g.193009 Transcript_87995/m.193009 type:complete len:117 (-) Transcript_87995:479-829(-)